KRNGSGLISPLEIKNATRARLSPPTLLRYDCRDRLPCIGSPCPVSSLSRPVAYIAPVFVPSLARLYRCRARFSKGVFDQWNRLACKSRSCPTRPTATSPSAVGIFADTKGQSPA